MRRQPADKEAVFRPWRFVTGSAEISGAFLPNVALAANRESSSTPPLNGIIHAQATIEAVTTDIIC